MGGAFIALYALIGLGAARAGTRVTLLVDDLHIRVIHRDTGGLIRELTLDPTRDYQPSGLPPGRLVAETAPTVADLEHAA